MIESGGVTRRDVILGGTAILAFSSVPKLAFAEPRTDRLWMSGPAVQGGLVLARAGKGSRAFIDDAPVRVADGLFCFGFGWMDEKPKSIRVVYEDGSTETAVVTPQKREYEVQKIDGLPEQYVSPNKELLERIAREAKLVADARAVDTDEVWFADKLDWPADGPISGVYGSYRVLNGEPREAHYGTDIAAPMGSPIRAPAEGIIRMAQELFLSGNTIILDHGHGVSTTYLHMSRMDVKPGDHVKRGGQMGLVGMTGRATGPHLCWRMNWFQTRLDTALAAVPRSSKA